MWYHYTIEIFEKRGDDKQPQWYLDNRYYMGEKDLNAFDLKDIPNKRKNAQFIKIL